jgi:ceramide glucosyltransferase
VTLGSPFEALVGLWATCQVGFLAVMVARAKARFSDAPEVAPRASSVRRALLVRPIAGAEPGLDDRLGHAEGASAVLLAVRDEGDLGFESATRAARKLSDEGARASVVLTYADGPNRKAEQIAVALARAAREGLAFDTVVVADSDVCPSRDDLHALLEALDGGAGAAYVPVAESPPRLGARLGDRANVAILSASPHAFPLLSGMDASLFVGKLCAIDRSALEATGGFETLTHLLAEDVELERRLRVAGHGVRAVRRAAVATRGGRELGEAVARFARWLGVVRAQRPHLLPSYLFVFASFLPILCASVLIASRGVDGAMYGAALAGAVLAARLSVAFEGRRIAGLPRALGAALVDVVLADVVLLWALLRAVTSREVAWRGQILRVSARGVDRVGPEPLRREVAP